MNKNNSIIKSSGAEDYEKRHWKRENEIFAEYRLPSKHDVNRM